MKRLAIGLLGVILQLPMSAHQSVQESTLVSVGGRQVEVVQAGTGSPTLVLESGGGEGAAQWSGILPELAKQTRVLAYSRAGFGRSAAIGPAPSVAKAKMLVDHGLYDDAQRELVDVVFGTTDVSEKARALDLLATVAVQKNNFRAALETWNRLIN